MLKEIKSGTVAQIITSIKSVISGLKRTVYMTECMSGTDLSGRNGSTQRILTRSRKRFINRSRTLKPQQTKQSRKPTQRQKKP